MIRKLEQKDKNEYLKLVSEFYDSDAVLHPTPQEYHLNTFNEIMRSDEYLICYIFEIDSEIAGFALLSKSFSPEVGGTIIWVEEIYLREQYRSNGIGSKFFELMLKEHPAARYRLEVEPDNERAKRLYTRLGYKPLPYMQMVNDESER